MRCAAEDGPGKPRRASCPSRRHAPMSGQSDYSSVIPKSREAEMTERALKRLISRLALMPFFPAKDEDRDAIGEIILEFAETDEQLEWLGKRMLELYQQWPGPRELRAC